MAATKKDKESTRQDRKLKKRKFEDAIPDLPGDICNAELQENSTSAGETNGSKKRKLVKVTGADLPDESRPANKSKKERKAERRAVQAAASNTFVPAFIEDKPVPIPEEAQPQKSKKNRNREKKRKAISGSEASEKTVGKSPRFIVFIGK
jgi:hypothetical protein